MVKHLNSYLLKLVYPWSTFDHFLICINDFSVNIVSTVKPFADISVFFVVNDSSISADKLNKDPQKNI